MQTQADNKLENIVYVNSVPVKALCAVGDDVKTFNDLVEHFEGIIGWIKTLEKNGWSFDYKNSSDWLFFEHDDRAVAVKELGEEYVKDLEEQWIEEIEYEDEIINEDK